MRAVYTAELKDRVARKFPAVPRSLTKRLLGAFLTALHDEIVDGVQVKIQKLGVIKIMTLDGREGVIPNGTVYKVRIRSRVSFKPSITLKKDIAILLPK